MHSREPVPSKLPVDDDRTVAPAHGEVRMSLDAAGSPPRGAPLPVGTLLRHFQIIDHLGEGGFGIVYLARDTRLEREVAIKEYLPSSFAWRTKDAQISVISERDRETFELGLNSFRNEARMLAHFDHPSLVKVYDYWDDNGSAYMAMPFYRGTTLKQFLKDSHEPPSEEWLKQLLETIGGALQEMHEEDCLHRDVAPDNILIRTSGVPLLLDFGAARRVISDRTHNLTVILKSGYAPIEQYADASTAQQGPWTDIYALAAVAYVAITGKVPVPSVSRVISDSLPPLSVVASGHYSDIFLRGLDRGLAVRSEDRPRSIAEFISALKPAGKPPLSASNPVRAVAEREQRLADTSAAAKSLPQKPHAVQIRTLLAGGIAAGVAVVLVTIFISSELQPRAAPESNSLPSVIPGSAPSAVTETLLPSSPRPAQNLSNEVTSADAPLVPQEKVPPAAPQRSTPRETAPRGSSLATAPANSGVKSAEMTRRAARQRVSARCTDVLSRLQLGETISSEEQALFDKECRR